MCSSCSRTTAPDAYEALARRVDLGEHEAEAWIKAAESMYLPYDAELGIHPQDAEFLDHEPWDFEHTPADKYPLLLHFHPLVIYRHQVLKQADVVLAMSLRNDQFSDDVRERNFEYYDPITTGDSSLSACVQAMAAAQIGYDDLAVRYFREALFVDLPTSTATRATAFTWRRAAASGARSCSASPACSRPGRRSASTRSLPSGTTMSFRVQHHGSRMVIDLDHDGCTVTVVSGDPVPIHTHTGLDRADAGAGGPRSGARNVGGGVATGWISRRRRRPRRAHRGGSVAAHLLRRSTT